MAEEAINDDEFGLEEGIDNEEVDVKERDDGSVDVGMSPRRQKRGDRYAQMQSELQAAKRERDEIKAQQRDFELRAAEEAGMLRRQNAPQQASPSDQLEEERERLAKQWGSMSHEQQQDPDTQKEYKRLAKENEDKRLDLRAEKAVGRRMQNQQVSTNQALMQAEFPDVVKDQRAVKWAEGYWQMEAAKGRTGDMNLTREAFKAAQEEFKIGGRKGSGERPSREEKGRFAGEGRGAGGGREKSGRVHMTKDYMRMADELYSHLPEGQRYQKYAREVLSSDKD